MNYSERIAKVVVESVLVGSSMHYHVDQSVGQYDFDLEYPDATRAAVEVTISTNEIHEATAAAIMNQRKGGSFITAKKCRKDWIVHPLAFAHINKIRSLIDEYLADVEVDGLEKFFSPIDAASHPSVARLYRELAVEGGSVVRWKTPVQIGIALPGSGGLVTSTNLQRAIELEAFKADNRKKLGSVSFPERHLFVYVSPRNFLAWAALLDEDPPADLPPLPVEITDVWAVTSAREQSQYAVWRGNRREGWRNLGAIQF